MYNLNDNKTQLLAIIGTDFQEEKKIKVELFCFLNFNRICIF
jgi:hypothetical protein